MVMSHASYQAAPSREYESIDFRKQCKLKIRFFEKSFSAAIAAFLSRLSPEAFIYLERLPVRPPFTGDCSQPCHLHKISLMRACSQRATLFGIVAHRDVQANGCPFSVSGTDAAKTPRLCRSRCKRELPRKNRSPPANARSGKIKPKPRLALRPRLRRVRRRQ